MNVNATELYILKCFFVVVVSIPCLFFFFFNGSDKISRQAREENVGN